MSKNEIYPKVFMWLFVGLLVTFLTGYSLSLNPMTVYNLVNSVSPIILMIIEFAIAIFFSVRLAKMSKMTAIICYILYSFITGITFSTIFIVYQIQSILFVFLVTSIVFLIFALIGYTTKKDLSSWSNVLFMCLIALIVAGIVNIFMKSSMLEFIITIVSILVFLVYTVYDMKHAEIFSNINSEAGPIYGAFQLYLDFINLFIDLLKLLGRSDD